MSEFDKELEQMDSAWNNAPETSDLPEGQYTMTIQDAKLGKTKTSGKLRASFQFTVAEGEHLGSSQWDGYNLDGENPVGMSFLKRLLTKLGYDIPESLAEVGDILTDIATKNPVVLAQVVKKGDFTNVRVQEVVADSGGKTAPSAAKAQAKRQPAARTPVEDVHDIIAAGEVEAAEGFAIGDVVTFENNGTEYTGTIKAIRDDGTYDVETESDVWNEVPADLLTKAASADSPEEDDGRESLALLAGAHGVEIQDGDGPEEIVAALRKHRWVRSDLTDDEIALLAEHGIKPATPAPKPTPKPAAQPSTKPAAKAHAKPTGKSGGKPIARKK